METFNTRREAYMDFAKQCYALSKHPFLTEGYTFKHMPTALESSLKNLIMKQEQLFIESCCFLDKYEG